MRAFWLISFAIFAIHFARAESGPESAWREYFARSREAMEADRNAIYAELEGGRLIDWSPPRTGRGVEGFLKRPDEWFAGAEARRIGEIVCSFQTPSGAWGKGLDLQTRPRLPGERFSSGASGWSYAGTFDNGATVSELRFLARAGFRAPLYRGLEYVLRAQFPNGGWPQVYPLMGGYHDAITFNDTAMVNVLRLLREVAGGRAEFAGVDADMRARSAGAVERGLACVLAAQIHGTGWAQQHDTRTLAPAAARAFEPVALASAETGGILRFLMELDRPSPDVIAAVHGAAEWLRNVEIAGMDSWSRFYEIGTDRPIFGDRDGSIHYDVNEISKERREGYAWFSNSPASALKNYAKWAAKNPLKP